MFSLYLTYACIPACLRAWRICICSGGPLSLCEPVLLIVLWACVCICVCAALWLGVRPGSGPLLLCGFVLRDLIARPAVPPD